MDFKKYDKIHAIGKEEVKDIFSSPDDEIVIEEKIDGGNFRFYFNTEHQIIFGSRTQQITSNYGELSNVAKNFTKVCEFVKERTDKTIETYKMYPLHKYVFIGEACFKHTITYDFAKMPPFIGYDVWDTEKNRYLFYHEAQMLFNQVLNLPFVNVVRTCLAKDIVSITDDIVPTQQYALDSAPDKQAEGVVFKNYSKQIFAKYVRNKFKEKNAETFGGQPKYNKINNTNNAEFLFKYVTNPRIEKMVMKLINEQGLKLDMTLMGKLIKSTYEDIIEEEWREILTSNWKLDFKKCRQLTAPRCRAVLSQMITNNQILGDHNVK